MRRGASGVLASQTVLRRYAPHYNAIHLPMSHPGLVAPRAPRNRRRRACTFPGAQLFCD